MREGGSRRGGGRPEVTLVGRGLHVVSHLGAIEIEAHVGLCAELPIVANKSERSLRGAHFGLPAPSQTSGNVRGRPNPIWRRVRRMSDQLPSLDQFCLQICKRRTLHHGVQQTSFGLSDRLRGCNHTIVRCSGSTQERAIEFPHEDRIARQIDEVSMLQQLPLVRAHPNDTVWPSQRTILS
jgi:hypothetical protein